MGKHEKEIVTAWHTKQLRCKPEKAVVKLYNDDGTFLSAVNIPTLYWPLNGFYEVFHCNNCLLCEDPLVAEIIDAVPYRIGHCYANAEKVTEALIAKGYDAKQYVGWLFVGDQYPIHHSWTVLGDHVLDLSDEFAVLHYNHQHFENAGEQDARSLLVDFSKWIRQYPNSQRMMPFGIPATNLLYIGCPCSREEGINIYNALARTYPDHPCTERLIKGKNMTRMQEMLMEAGIY